MRLAVLGGGLQGACVAMALADAGHNVDLFDENERPLTQASLRNEGKVHLGYVYAHDRTLETARLMIKGAAAFSRLLRRWIGSDIDKLPVSTPYHYAVRRDGLLTVDEVEAHLRACHAIACEEQPGQFEYFGMDYRVCPQRIAGHGNIYDEDRIAAAFRTQEIAIDTEALATSVAGRLTSDPKINCILQAKILAATPFEHAVDVVFTKSGAKFSERYDHVVNALWDGLLSIDATAGIEPARPWLFRVKYYIRAYRVAPEARPPSVTIVLGPYGDIVDYGNGSVYLSWYPAAMTHTSHALAAPDYPAELNGKNGKAMFDAIMEGLAANAPGLINFGKQIDNYRVSGGTILAWGASDIDDPKSRLHERATIGPQSFGRYHSINTGKLTMAPLFGKIAADRILSTLA